MVTNNFLCIKEVTKVVNLTLPSMYNTNEISGICNALESWKRQYVKQLQGIVVGYKNVSLQSKRGFIKVDCPEIFCIVKATFELFYPTIGSIIKGKVNRISQDHIGCLVHDTINVTVHRTADVSSDISDYIVLDHYILFQITRINFKWKFIHVKGKITEECVTLMKESGLFVDNTAKTNNSVLTCASPVFSHDNNSSIFDNNETGSLDISANSLSQTSHKKKKKHKKSKERLSMSPSLLCETLENDIDQVQSKQSRKRKREMLDVSSTSPSTTVENEAPVPRKKIKTENFNATDVNQVEFTDNCKMETDNLNTSIDTFSQVSHKKKKHKKSKGKFSMSPSLTSDSLENDLNNIELTQSLKRKREESDINSTSSSNGLKNDTEVPKKKIKTEKFDTTNANHMELSQSFDNPSSQNPPSYSNIKFEREFLTSPDLFDEPLNEDEAKSIKSKKKKKKKDVSDKNKLKKKKKDKLKKDSKKDKLNKDSKKDKLKKGSKKDKKKKIKVISTKKKLHGHNAKLKKNKKKDKSSKVNKKNKVKNEKIKCMPE